MNVEIYWKIIDILTTILSGALYFWFISKISKGMKNATFVALAYVSFFCIMIISIYLHIAPLLKYFFIIGACDIFILMGYRITIKDMLIGNLCDLILSLFSDMLIVGIFIGVNGYRIINIIRERGVVNFQTIFLSKTITFILLLLVLRKINPKDMLLSKKDMFLLIVQTIYYIISMYMIIEMMIFTNRNKIILIILSIIILVCYINFYFLTCRRAKDRKTKEKCIKKLAYTNKALQYCKLKEESRLNMQKLAHDMKHHVLAMQGMIMKDEVLKAQKYLNKIEDVIKENKRYFDTGCSIIDVILSEKTSQAEHCGINVNILYEPECLKEYESFPLCSIMGNAFDNAMRAVIDSDEKWIDIKIRLDKERKVLIMVNNPYCGILKKKDGKLITTKRDKGCHGLGLKCIEDAVNSFKGEMSILDKDNVFSLMIII